MIVALDSEALTALAGPDSKAKRRVRQAMEAAARTGQNVVVPTLVLAGLYRGSGRSHLVDSLLARHEEAIGCRDTDPDLARFVGAVLHAAGVGSEHIVDAHVVAIAAEAGGGVLLTSDADDLSRLAAPYHSILVQPVT